MSRQAITFDFHDTLVRCDAWFQLEIRTLPSMFLVWHQTHLGGVASPAMGPLLEARYRRLRTAIIEHGHELNAERCLAVVFSQAGIAVPETHIANGVDALMTEALKSASPVPGAIETVHALSDAGIALGVVSSAVHHPFLEWSLARFDIRACFQTVVTSADAGYYKSRPEIYWTALTRLDADAPRSLHVGDSARFDVEGAARAGMRTAWLRPRGASNPTVPPDVSLDSLHGSASGMRDLLRAIA